MNTYIKEKLAIIDAADQPKWVPVCPKCGSTNISMIAGAWACHRFAGTPEACGHEWTATMAEMGRPLRDPEDVAIADSRNHRRAELEALRIAVEALERISGDVTSDGYSYGSTHADVGECQRAATQALDAIRAAQNAVNTGRTE